MRDFIRSVEGRAAINATVATVVSVILVVILRKGLGINDSATTVAILLVPLLVYGVASGRLKELSGPGGWDLKFAEEVKERLDQQEAKAEEQGKELERQQQLVNKIVANLLSFYHYKHLWYITFTTEYFYRDNENFRREMVLLQDLGFIKPIHAPYLNFYGGEHSLIDKNLSEEVEPTPIGRMVLELRGRPEEALKWDRDHGLVIKERSPVSQ